MKLLYLLILLFSATCFANETNETVPEVGDRLVIVLMGDTQYHFFCEPNNWQCKKASKQCRILNNLPFGLIVNSTDKAILDGMMQCVEYESRYANRIQRQTIVSLYRKFPEIAGLIINGDLTNFGHLHQLEEFKKIWITNFPLRVFPGLGNHDYENNINDCSFNICAHAMLYWFELFGKNNSFTMDYIRKGRNGIEQSYTGSMSYNKLVCSPQGKYCAHVIQLNNALDYETKFKSLLVTFNILSGIDFLKKQLQYISYLDSDHPIIINMHQCEGTRKEKMIQILNDWFYETRDTLLHKKVIVAFAHLHQKHEVHNVCIRNVSVPFIYVGSVPNNRFSILHYEENIKRIYGMSARDRFYYPNQTRWGILGNQVLLGPCLEGPASYKYFKNDGDKLEDDLPSDT